MRGFYLAYSADSVTDALKDILAQYKLDRKKTQARHLEVWCEKEALAEILRPLCRKFHVGLVIGHGAFSITCRKELAERLTKDGRPAVIFYLGDYDPAGFMFRDHIQQSLELFGSPKFEICHVALTLDQVWAYDLPPQMVKTTDSRAGRWREHRGEEVCELDALRPGVLEELLRKAIEQNLSVPGAEVLADPTTVQIRANDFEEGYRQSLRLISLAGFVARAQAFQAVLAEQPNADALRLRLSDWLEERWLNLLPAPPSAPGCRRRNVSGAPANSKA